MPWFRSNYNMTLDDKGWQVMPGWAMCPGKMSILCTPQYCSVVSILLLREFSSLITKRWFVLLVLYRSPSLLHHCLSPLVSGVYDSCPGCLPDPNGGGDAPTFSFTNCIYFSNDKFWASLDVLAKTTKSNRYSNNYHVILRRWL